MLVMMIWTCVQIELKHERIGCHWGPLQSSKPPSTNALPIAQSSRIQCNIMHCSSNPPVFPNALKEEKASHRTWARGWGQSYN